MKLSLTACVLLACLAGGCATRMEAYKSMSDYKQANEQAELIVSGKVTAAETLEHFKGDEVTSANFGTLGIDCVAHEKATLAISSTLKGKAPAGSMEINYYGPCFHPTKKFQLVHKDPAIRKGDLVKAYLVNRDGQWWIIAHELQNPPPGPNAGAAVRIFADAE